MMELIAFGLFLLLLLGCVLAGISIVYAMAGGMLIFFSYGLWMHYTWKELLRMIKKEVRTTKTILILFALIGMMTGMWRASGTIAAIVSFVADSRLVNPATVILITFLLTSAVSSLIGTSFGTMATAGVICMSIGSVMNVAPVWVGGAALSGIMFGDRCSPFSSSALLVCTLTDTEIYENVKHMLRSSVLPFLLTCMIYLIAGYTGHQETEMLHVGELFSKEFTLNWIVTAPAAIMMVFCLLRVNVKTAMAISILLSILLAYYVQDMTGSEICSTLLRGYHAKNDELAHMLNGGGLGSMLTVMINVSFATGFSGIFKGTGMLDRIQKRITDLGKQITPYGTVLFTAIFTAMISCSQTLAIILTAQLCAQVERRKGDLAWDIEDSAVLIAALVPWSIAGSVPLKAAGAPMTSMAAACYLYLLPLIRLIGAYRKHKG